MMCHGAILLPVLDDDYVSTKFVSKILAMRCYYALWLALMAFVGFATGQSDPTHQITRFDNPPARLFFFDDTNVRMHRKG